MDYIRNVDASHVWKYGTLLNKHCSLIKASIIKQEWRRLFYTRVYILLIYKSDEALKLIFKLSSF